MGGDSSFPDLKSDTEDISSCSIEQIEEMILGIFKNSAGSKKIPSLNIDSLNFGYDDADSFDCPVVEEKKNKVFETVKEPKIKNKKNKLSQPPTITHGASNSRDSNLNNLNQKNINGSNYLQVGLQPGMQGLSSMTDENLNLLLAGMGMPIGGMNFGNTGMQNLSNLSGIQNIIPSNTNNLSNEQLMQLWNTLNNPGSVNTKQNENLCNSLLLQLLGSEASGSTNNDELLINLAKSMGINVRPDEFLANLNSGINGMNGISNPAVNQHIPQFLNNISKPPLGNSGNINENILGMNPLGLGNIFPGGMPELNNLLTSLGMGGIGDANMDFLMASILQGGGSQTSNQGHNIINNFPSNINPQNLQNIQNSSSVQSQLNPSTSFIPSPNTNAINISNLSNQNNITHNSQILPFSSNGNENIMQIPPQLPLEINSMQNQSISLNNNQNHTPGILNKSLALDTDCSGANKNLQNGHTGKENSATNPSQFQGCVQLSQAANDELNNLQQFGDVLKIISGSGSGENNTFNGLQIPNLSHLSNLPIQEINNPDVLPLPVLKIEDQDPLSSLGNIMMNPINNSMIPVNAMYPMKPNENILGDDNSMNMVLNYLNQGGHSNMDLNNLIQFLDMNNGLGGNSLASMLNQSQPQVYSQNQLMPNYSNVNVLPINHQLNQIVKNETSQKDLDKTIEEKEDSTNGNKSQSINNTGGSGVLNNMNNPFGFMSNQLDQNYNLGLGIPALPINNMSMNNNLLNDPLLGMMNQFLMGQPQHSNLSNNVQNIHTPNYNQSMDNYFLNNFNPMELYKFDPSMINPSQINQNNNSIGGSNLK